MAVAVARSFAGNQAADKAAGAAMTKMPVNPFKIEQACEVYKNIVSSDHVNTREIAPTVIRPQDNNDANRNPNRSSSQHMGPTPTMKAIVPQFPIIATVLASQCSGYAYRTPRSIGPYEFQMIHYG